MKNLVVAGTVRSPRVKVLIDGDLLQGVESAEIEANSHRQADTFHLKVAFNTGFKPIDWWMSQDRHDTQLDIRILMDGDEQSLIIGRPDEIMYEPEQGILNISGRDLSGLLQDTPAEGAFQNQTSSEIATAMANKVGLTPVVTATKGDARRYYGSTHTHVHHKRGSSNDTAWNVLSKLADDEGYDLYVSGNELHFEPEPDPTTLEPYGIHWDQDNANKSNVMALTVSSQLHVAAKKVVVEVQSWASQQGHGLKAISPAGASTKGAKVYPYRRPNMTQAQAQAFADQKYTEITKHGFTLDFQCPGELNLTCRDAVQLSGLGDAAQLYFVDSIRREISMSDGFQQTVALKNKHPDAEAQP